MTIIVEKAKSKQNYLRAWTEGMKHLHWFKETRLFDYNAVEMVEEISRDFGKQDNVFLVAKLGEDSRIVGVLGIKLQKRVGVLRRWEPAVPLKEKNRGAGEVLIKSGFQWLREKGAQKAVCMLKYPCDLPHAGDWHASLYKKCGFKQRGPVGVQLLADLSQLSPTERLAFSSSLLIKANESYTLENFAEFVQKAYVSTPEDKAIHGWDPYVSIRKETLRGLQSIKQGKHGLSPLECWKVALVNGEPAGFIVSFIPKDRYRPTYGVIGLIGVFPEFRRGIAYALVLEMHKYFRKQKCRYSYVGTPKINEKAINLYKKAGYKPVFELIAFEKQL